jgi:hypothetical protein
MAEDKLGKAVRIDEKQYNPKGAKVEVWTKGRHKYLVQEIQKGTSVPTSTIRYINGDKISASLTDDEVIEAWLSDNNAQIKILNDNGANRQFYKVIQDPYSDDETVTKRVYGDKSPYYLNNGCKLFIEWTGRKPNPEFVLGTFSTAEAAGKNSGPNRFLNNQSITSNKDQISNLLPSSTWVVPTGEVNAALQPVPNYRDYSEITNKKITIHLPDGFTENGGKGHLILTEKDELRYSTDNTAVEDTSKYSKLEDSSIISTMIWKFKSEVEKLHGIKTSDYDLKLCSPDSKACSLIPYKSPLEPPVKVNDLQTPPGNTQSTPTKIKFTIDGLPTEIIIKAKEDLDTFTIWTGPIPKINNGSGNVDDYEDGLGEEYSESNFAGSEEELAKITQMNAIDDVPTGPSFDESLSGEVDKSAIGRGPVLGSKLTNKSGSSMINLAGHRLTPILKDLENYLNNNGYPGTKIGNNGVMRPLRDSAYPSSPARATASLHGAGLAIDVIFKIPGFNWSGIGDNKNLAANANLTRVINNFVKGQGDITWGASWGKGSKPADGVVFTRGITEYHHFEIRSDLIPKYWEPVKDELAKFGFKPTDLKSPGRGGNLHKLMLKLLGDTA